MYKNLIIDILLQVKNLDNVVDQSADEVIESSSDEEDENFIGIGNNKRKMMKYSKDQTYLDKSGRLYSYLLLLLSNIVKKKITKL